MERTRLQSRGLSRVVTRVMSMSRVIWIVPLFVLIASCGDTDRSSFVPESVDTEQEFSSIESFVADYWRRPIPPQGPAPEGWVGIEASLDPEACGSCHTAKLEDWSTTLHAGAYSPGLSGQLVNWEESAPGTVRGCLACHAPLSEQSAWREAADGSLESNPTFEPGLRDHGITCAACHVRGHQRFGPLPRGGESALSAEGAPHGGVTRTAFFSDARFCSGCHQFEAPAPNGKSIQNTYEEWRASSWATEGVTCQDCHMPDRRHLWRGIHDPEMVRSALTITWIGLERDSARSESAADPAARAIGLEILNSGAGHHFPTYVTPEVIVEISLLDDSGAPVPDHSNEWRIARKVENRGGNWIELSDTRIAAGEEVLFLLEGTSNAAKVRATIRVLPDAVYRDLFAGFLVGALSDSSRVLLTEAMNRASQSPFVLYDETMSIRR
ncbi:MAG: hypothetical protein M8860_00340 [marine benthic group bacterium]|nr:hypothetical protein [Candidatus Carthagonibacter metallireducens]